MKRAKPRQHVRRLRSGKRIGINPGVRKRRNSVKRRSVVCEGVSDRDKNLIIKNNYSSLAIALKKEGKVRIPDIGILVVKNKPATKARKGINPFTKEEMTFKAKPAKKVVKFHSSKRLKESL